MSASGRTVDVLWLFEHVARELDVACACAAILREAHGLSVDVRHVYRDARACLEGPTPRVVAHPFVYFIEGALATEDYVRAWPAAVHFNLAWEQLHYSANVKMKAPADAFTRERVRHHAWGRFYGDWLVRQGVPADGVFVNGQPAYALYRPPYRGGFESRAELAARHGLDAERRWVFVPENYRWAFVSDKRLATLVAWGGDADEIRELRAVSHASLAELLRWCRDLGRHDGVEVVFRTRPATGEALMRRFFDEQVGEGSAGLRFLKEGSVREWVLASDLTVSSYSTSLIEAAVAGRHALMALPRALPAGLHCDWYDLAPCVRDQAAFERVCLEGGAPATALAAWAERELLPAADPIGALADEVARLVREQAGRAAPAPAPVAAPPADRTYFNPATHDRDDLSLAEIEARIAHWSRVLRPRTPCTPESIAEP